MARAAGSVCGGNLAARLLAARAAHGRPWTLTKGVSWWVCTPKSTIPSPSSGPAWEASKPARGSFACDRRSRAGVAQRSRAHLRRGARGSACGCAWHRATRRRALLPRGRPQRLDSLRAGGGLGGSRAHPRGTSNLMSMLIPAALLQPAHRLRGQSGPHASPPFVPTWPALVHHLRCSSTPAPGFGRACSRC